MTVLSDPADGTTVRTLYFTIIRRKVQGDNKIVNIIPCQKNNPRWYCIMRTKPSPRGEGVTRRVTDEGPTLPQNNSAKSEKPFLPAVGYGIYDVPNGSIAVILSRVFDMEYVRLFRYIASAVPYGSRCSLTESGATIEKPAPHPLRFTQHLPPEGKAIRCII